MKAYDPTGRVLVSWDGNYEAANAVAETGYGRRQRAYLGSRTTRVPTGTFPVTRLVEYLSRHGSMPN
jgi:hypothetical protein